MGYRPIENVHSKELYACKERILDDLWIKSVPSMAALSDDNNHQGDDGPRN
jgi:hypothetical protein